MMVKAQKILLTKTLLGMFNYNSQPEQIPAGRQCHSMEHLLLLLHLTTAACTGNLHTSLNNHTSQTTTQEIYSLLFEFYSCSNIKQWLFQQWPTG